MENKIRFNKIKPCGLCCIKVKNLGVSFGNEKVLEDVNLHIHCGTITAIIGRNGAGKSTFVRALLDEVKHTGAVEFRDSEDGKIKSFPIGYVPQNLNIDKNIPMSVYDLFASFCFNVPVFIKSKKVTNKVKNALKVFEADDLIDKSIGNLSGGELQRVLLAMAVYNEPKLLILDEPVSGIDNNGMKLFYDKMRYLRDNFDMAILIVSHDLDYVYKYADNVVLLEETVIKIGTPKEVYNTQEFDKIFGGFSLSNDINIKSNNAYLNRKNKMSSKEEEEAFDASYKGGKDE